MRRATVFCYSDVQYEYGSRPQLYLILTKDAARYSGSKKPPPPKLAKFCFTPLLHIKVTPRTLLGTLGV